MSLFFVLKRLFKNIFRQRLAPKFWFDYDLRDMPLPVFRAVLKKQFAGKAHLTDVRIIDREVEECYQVCYFLHVFTC